MPGEPSREKGGSLRQDHCGFCGMMRGEMATKSVVLEGSLESVLPSQTAVLLFVFKVGISP